MKNLSDKELNEINGGGLKLWASVVGGLAVFVIGIIDGYIRPLRCN